MTTEQKFRVLLVPYNKEPTVVVLDPAEDQLDQMQRLVNDGKPGGLIERVTVEYDKRDNGEPEGSDVGEVDAWCNEEGLMLFANQPNRQVLWDMEGPPRDRAVMIHGPFFVARSSADGEIIDLTDADIAKYSRLYRL